jgi:Ca2+-binding EF-hand superfamily protein
MGLSILSRGTMHEKLEWIFCLYDINRDELITLDEVTEIVQSVHDMLGMCVSLFRL